VHQVEPEAGSLPLAPHLRTRQPDLRDQVAAGELGQHPGVDAAREKRDSGRPCSLGSAQAIAFTSPIVITGPGV